jgi:hypothetical protein
MSKYLMQSGSWGQGTQGFFSRWLAQGTEEQLVELGQSREMGRETQVMNVGGTTEKTDEHGFLE